LVIYNKSLYELESAKRIWAQSFGRSCHGTFQQNWIYSAGN